MCRMWGNRTNPGSAWMRTHSGGFRSRQASRTFLISAWCDGVEPPTSW